MLDKKTTDFLDKLAMQDATGMSQYKQRVVKSKRKHTGAGTALGAVIGAGSGALSKKYKPLTAGAGALLGALTGREIGKRTVSKTRTKTREGVVKKQQKTKAEKASPEVPNLKDSPMLNLLRRSR